MFDIVAGPEGQGHLRLVGRFDAAQADRARAAFGAVQGSITADCSELDYISSLGIGILLETHKRLQDKGQAFRLVNVHPKVRTILTYAGLDKVLTLG